MQTWASQHELQGVLKRQGVLKPGLMPLWLISPHCLLFAGSRAASQGQQSQPGPLSRWGSPCLWFPDTCHYQNDTSGIFALSAAGGSFVCLPHPHLEWLCNLRWRCVTTYSHDTVFILHWFVTGLEKTLAANFWESTKKANMTQDFPNNRGLILWDAAGSC